MDDNGQDADGEMGPAFDHAREGRRLIWHACAAQWRGLTLGIVAGLAWTGARVAVPWVLRAAIDSGVTTGEPGRVWAWAGIVLAAGVVAGLCGGYRRHMAFRESLRMEQFLRDRLIAHVHTLDAGYHDRTSPGELMSRVHEDLRQVWNLAVLVPLFVSNVVGICAVAVIMLATDAVLAVCALAPLAALQLLGRRFARRARPVALQVQARAADVSAIVEESLSGARVVKGLGLESRQEALLGDRARDLLDAVMASTRVNARYGPVMTQIPALGTLAVLGIGGSQVINGSLSIGTLVAYTVSVGMIVWPGQMIASTITQAQPAFASAGRVAEVLATDPAVTDPVEPVSLPATPPLGKVRFRDVSFWYPRNPGAGDVQSHDVLDRFSVDIEPGETVAIVGGTGSGKSTVARLLARFHDVTAGAIEIDGVDVRDLKLRDLRGCLGFVFEDTFLFNGSVAENIAFAHDGATPSEIERAARLAGAHDFVVGLPDGYDTPVGERGHLLSGGQRQRIAIARAVLVNPRILVLDDATSAVDAAKEREIREAIVEILGRRTTMIIAHRPATVALADRVVYLAEGRVVDEGTHDELVARDPGYRRTLDLDQPDRETPVPEQLDAREAAHDTQEARR